MDSLSWSRFLPWFSRQWKRGEHISIVGPTGSGKSYLALQLIKVRSNYVLFLTKKDDETLDRFIKREDIELIRKWPPSGFENKVALWPKFTGIGSYQEQHTVFRDAIDGYRKGTSKIDGIYTEGEWTILIDEVMYFTDELHLEQHLKMLWSQGRSAGISLVAGTQRPFEVPRVMFNQWSHLFVFQTTDKDEIDRIARVGGNISTVIRQNVPVLGRHEFLYINRVTAQSIRSKVS